jgi:hypothetical protein
VTGITAEANESLRKASYKGNNGESLARVLHSLTVCVIFSVADSHFFAGLSSFGLRTSPPDRNCGMIRFVIIAIIAQGAIV